MCLRQGPGPGAGAEGRGQGAGAGGWALGPPSWVPEAERRGACSGLQDSPYHVLPLLPTGPRKGEEVEEWAPTEKVSE